ncbi:MAG TPA: tripartite tricarboxylate transporter substrate binding protein BugD [Casimicrobiaceae bacterium]|nr:tripartite tricarboxylate transporter substrate binding protein BugD [Casimicrobiaceae bacterium]
MLAGIAAALAAIALGAPPALAQNYPTKPITLLVPFAAGGPTDTVARSLAQSMGKAIGQTIVVENAPGAGGTIAPTKLKNATPDGYTLLIAHIGMSTAPSLYRSLPFKPIEDFEHIGQVVDVPMTFIARKDLPPNDFKALVDYVKANKEKVTLANAGVGAASHLCGLLFMSAIQADLTTVPYKGTAPAINDLLGGQVDILCDQTTNTTSYIKSGRIKAYAVTSKTRVESLKELPPAAEAGLPGFEVTVWHGVYAPKGTPKPVVDKLVAALQAGIVDAGFVQKMHDLGSVVVSKDKATPEGLRNHLKAEIDKWTPIIRKAGVYAD